MEPVFIVAAALLGAVGGAVLGMLARTYWSSQSMKAAHAEAAEEHHAEAKAKKAPAKKAAAKKPAAKKAAPKKKK